MALRFLPMACLAAALLLPVAGITLAAESAPAVQADDRGAVDSRLRHVAGDMPEAYEVVLVLAGLLASLILIRGPARRRAEESVKRIPGDAP